MIFSSYNSGSVSIPGTTQLRVKDILTRLLVSKATCIVASPDTAEIVDEVCCKTLNKHTTAFHCKFVSHIFSVLRAFPLVKKRARLKRRRTDDVLEYYAHSGWLIHLI